MKLKIPTLLLTLAAIFLSAAGRGEVGIFFVMPQGDAPGAVALRGARDAAKDLSKELGRNIEILPTYAKSENDTATLLENAYLKGATGAIFTTGRLAVSPDGKTAIGNVLKTLSKKNFPTAAIGENAMRTDAQYRICNNEDSLMEILGERLAPYRGKLGFRGIAIASEGDGAYEFSKETSEDIAKKFCGSEIIKTDFFSAYAQNNKSLIDRLDNYALIFLSPNPLADAKDFPPDKDRLYCVIFGARAATAKLLANGQANLCIMPDYYGFGYAAVRRIVEKRPLKTPTAGDEALAPKVYDASNLNDFLKDWQDYVN